MTHIIEYYYDKSKQSWKADIVDENGKTVDFIYCKSLNKIKYEIDLLKQNYNVIRIFKRPCL